LLLRIPGQQQVAPRQAVHVVPLVLERAAAGVPAEVVDLVTAGRQVRPPHHRAVARRPLVDVDDGERVGALAGPVEGDDVGEPFGRCGGGVGGGAVEGGVGGGHLRSESG
jgi:hypothetical protein